MRPAPLNDSFSRTTITLSALLQLAGLLKILVQLIPTLGSYYKDDPTVRQQKIAADVEAAAAAKPAAAAVTAGKR
jgi:hypothetical protein